MAFKFDEEQLKRDIASLQKEFDKVRENMGKRREFFHKEAIPIIIDDVKEVFATDGIGKWLPRKDDLPHPLLRKTLAMYKGWTMPGSPGNIMKATDMSLTYGVGGPQLTYPIYLETGTVKMVSRPVKRLVLQPQRGARRSLKRKLSERFIAFILPQGGI